MMYINKRNGKQVNFISQNDRFKTVTLQDVATRDEFNVTTSTFKRWYKKVEDEEVVEPMPEEVVEAVSPEQPSAVVDTAPEEDSVKKARVKKEMLPEVHALHEYVLHTCEQLGGTVFVPAKDIKFRGLKVGKHMFAKYNWSNKSVMLFVRAQALGLEAPLTPVNHTFNDRYTFTADTPENRAEIYRIMKTAYDWQLCKNLAKTK